LVERQPSKLNVAGSSPVARFPQTTLPPLAEKWSSRSPDRRLRSPTGRS